VDDSEDIHWSFDSESVGVYIHRLFLLAYPLRDLFDTKSLADARHPRYIYIPTKLHRLYAEPPAAIPFSINICI
jgi:hypothetical protein